MLLTAKVVVDRALMGAEFQLPRHFLEVGAQPTADHQPTLQYFIKDI